MENENNQTVIPLQLPKELQEELVQLKNQLHPEKTEEEWYALIVQTGLATVKSRKAEKQMNIRRKK